MGLGTYNFGKNFFNLIKIELASTLDDVISLATKSGHTLEIEPDVLADF